MTQALSAILSDDLLARITPASDGWGWVVVDTKRVEIRVVPMIYNDRVVVIPHDSPMSVERYWCFAKGGAAFLAALAWDGDDESEPTGWIKSWDQRYAEAS